MMLMLSGQPHLMTVEMTDLPQSIFRQCLGQPGQLQYKLWIQGPQYLHQLLLLQCHHRSPLHQSSRHLQKPSRMHFFLRRLRTPELPAGDRLQELWRTMLRVPTGPIQFDIFGTCCQRGRICIDHRLRERVFRWFFSRVHLLLVCLFVDTLLCVCLL